MRLVLLDTTSGLQELIRFALDPTEKYAYVTTSGELDWFQLMASLRGTSEGLPREKYVSSGAMDTMMRHAAEHFSITSTYFKTKKKPYISKLMLLLANWVGTRTITLPSDVDELRALASIEHEALSALVRFMKINGDELLRENFSENHSLINERVIQGRKAS